MRGIHCLAILAMVMASPAAHAQVRRMPGSVGRPMQVVTRPVTVRPASHPIRVVGSSATVVRALPPRPANSSTSSAGSIAAFNTGFAGQVLTPVGGAFNQFPNADAGLGIDFDRLASAQRERAVQAIIDPITQHEIALALQFRRVRPAVAFVPAFGFDGYGYGEVPATVEPQQQPQVIVIEPPAPASAPQAAPAAAAEAAPPPAPLPDVGQFLLVRRDGTTISAVAFTQQGKNVVYITSDGERHTITLDQLDLNATEQRNAERGTILHLTR